MEEDQECRTKVRTCTFSLATRLESLKRVVASVEVQKFARGAERSLLTGGSDTCCRVLKSVRDCRCLVRRGAIPTDPEASEWCNLDTHVAFSSLTVAGTISPLLHALAGCGRRCDTLILGGNGVFPLDTEGVASSRPEQLCVEFLPSAHSTCKSRGETTVRLASISFTRVLRSSPRVNVWRLPQSLGSLHE